ncbi:MAG: 2-oxo acid dehydrogenase subunit E2 [Deltaproteobacteria bacterium]|nr:2-oxo acid dehydrogenase subunit E2 [Deltaproteobacteria bacterium]TLN04067.1 MAG: 2-oxo acid dehydrogenase subunit E2 [bacterium]
MPFDFTLPDLGEGITEAEIRKWLVRVGDTVLEHQPVVEVETDKAVVEVPTPRAGKVLSLARSEGETVQVGETLLSIVEEGEELKPGPEPEIQSKSRSVSVVGELPEAEETLPTQVLATPAVRALAREKGLSLEGITGTGPRGSITREDLLSAGRKGAAAAGEPGEVERIPLRGLRRTIARNLLKSHQMTVCVTGMEEVDVTELGNLRVRENAGLDARGIHLTYFPFIIKAVQHALREHPYLNAAVDEEGEAIILKKYCNIGFAVDTAEGLVVPVLRNVEQKTIIDLAKELQTLSERARERTITLAEMKGSSFTISNFGQFGGSFATPIINYPDVAILGCGRISDKPWVVKGEIAIRKILPLSLTFDHRVTDGGDATRFLSRVASYLEDPALLFIESV